MGATYNITLGRAYEDKLLAFRLLYKGTVLTYKVEDGMTLLELAHVNPDKPVILLQLGDVFTLIRCHPVFTVKV